MTQKMIINSSRIGNQYETHSFRYRLFNFIFYARVRETNLETNLSNFS